MNADSIGESTLRPTHLPPGGRTGRSKHLISTRLSAFILSICGFKD
jgi:hypothetical protein